jgi:hypothetical protein
LFGITNTSDRLSLSDFLVGVGQLKFRGTSVLFRLKKTISDLLSLIMANKYDENYMLIEEINETAHSAKMNIYTNEPCYEIAKHSVKIKRNGTLVDISSIWDLDGIFINFLFLNSNFKYI